MNFVLPILLFFWSWFLGHDLAVHKDALTIGIDVVFVLMNLIFCWVAIVDD